MDGPRLRSSAHPLTREEIETKFARLAAKVLPEKRVRELRQIVYGVDALGNVGDLAKALV